MNADERRLILDQLTEKVIGCAHQVSNGLGCGFLEKVYENALAVELQQAGLSVEQQRKIEVRYKGVLVGDYIADLVVEDSVIIEVKAVKALEQIHVAQCLNYLKATGYHVCLLINFGTPRAGIKRIVNEF
jgi:GxxExxY protein